jgi:hypothetical protein
MPARTTAWVADADAHGRAMGNQLVGPEEATTFRVRDGKLLVTDGPFAETKELIVGFDLLECDSVDEARRIASTHPMADYGAIELRAFV